MNEGTNIDRLKELLDSRAKRQIPTQVVWGRVKTVDWENKKCTVTGELDGLDYYEVSLGVKNQIIKPKKGAKCLIGSVGNVETDNYLIDVEEFEEKIFISNKVELHITEQGFTIKRGNADLKLILKEAFEQLKTAKILTPAGPGNFSPTDVTKFEELKTQILNLFK